MNVSKSAIMPDAVTAYEALETSIDDVRAFGT